MSAKSSMGEARLPSHMAKEANYKLKAVQWRGVCGVEERHGEGSSYDRKIAPAPQK
jgi:hypothetical protein